MKTPKPKTVAKQPPVNNIVNNEGITQPSEVIHTLPTGYPQIVHTPREQLTYWWTAGRKAGQTGKPAKSSPFRRLSDLSEHGIDCRDAWLAGWHGDPEELIH